MHIYLSYTDGGCSDENSRLCTGITSLGKIFRLIKYSQLIKFLGIRNLSKVV